MKTLSLYVDKWFITVAVNIDGNVIPLTLPNGEDRVWLFFHEDTANNRVVYGKTFEDNYRDKEPHYIGDVFPLIETGEHHFTRYDNRPEEMREIFKVANIFSHLHDAIKDQDKVDTYISFSTDISDIARLKFLQELKEANFNVIESVARISHLGLEEAKKRGIFTVAGMYLVLVATNDNMHFSLYKSAENIFVRVNESSLLGYGLDVRKRALIESVVENINRTTRFLSTPEEFAKENKRQERFADEWLRLIANRKFGLPVTLPNVTFAVAPNNPYSVTIKPSDLDQRTEGLVDDIVRKIADFVRANNVQPHEISGIAFIGNTFTNTKFSEAINSRFIVDENKLVKYREVELPKVVSVYAQINHAQFKEATEDFVKDAQLQEELKRQAREEEARKKAAQAAAEKEQAEKEAAQKAEKDYKNAIENVERFESEHDYEEMLSWVDIALTHRPEDEYAKNKQALAQQLLAEQRANNKQFSIILQRVKTAYSEGRWNDTISQCDIALELRPDSEEVLRIKRDSIRKLDIKEKVINFLNRADMFFAQKLYSEAIEEVGKVLNLDSSNTEAISIKRRISEIRSKQETKVQELVKKLKEAEVSDDFDTAIQICDVLIEEDVANLTKWTAKKERILSCRKEQEENKRKLSALKEEINNAHFDEDWTKLKLLCVNYLSISADDSVSQFLLKAKKRLEETRVREAKDKALAAINKLIVDQRMNEAEEELARFAQSYPSEHSVVKDLRKKIFSFGGCSAQTPIESPKRNPIGFNSHQPEEDDFFGTSSTPRRVKQTSQPKKKNLCSPKKTDDFFDRQSKNVGDHITPTKQITNNDFNF